MNEALAKVGMVALVLLAGFVTGLKVQEWRFDAGERVKLEQQIADEREAARKARSDADDVSDLLAKAQAKADEDRINFDRRIKDERRRGTQLVVGCKPDAGTVPGGPVAPAGMERGASNDDPLLTGDFVRLWNIALLRAEPAGSDTGPPDGETEAPGAVGPWDALENLNENAGRWAECRRTVEGWQELARRRGWAGSAAP